MKVAVIGAGYVGLVTAACLSESGNDVVGIDVDRARIESLNAGGIPIYEPGLEEMVRRNRSAGRLKFTTDYAPTIPSARIIFIAVGTPESKTNEREADLSAVWSVADRLGEIIGTAPVPTGSKIVVVKSTVPVGTNRKVLERILAKGCKGVDVASNPEFLKEGAALEDFQKPDRVVVGVRRPEVADILHQLYSPFLRTERPFLVMTPESAEMTKYVANALLATKISFINQMALLCDKLGADVNDVRRGIGHDQRIGFQFLHPGPGYGGSCFPKDVREIIATANRAGVDLAVMKAVDAANEAQKRVLPERIRHHFGNLASRTIAIWGLAFKPRTDDIRESPALVLLLEMLDAGARVQVHDPEAMPNIKDYLSKVRPAIADRVVYCDLPYDALNGADAMALVTEWSDYRSPDFDEMRRRMKSPPTVFDGRNIYEPATLEAMGFAYFGIGRGRK